MINTVRMLRLALSGAVLGAAAAGVVGHYFGFHVGSEADALGAGAGFVTVVAIKVAHII